MTDRQRIDKWLWHARVVRTRTSAAALVDEGHVRLNGERVDAASRPVKAGDVVTVALDRTVRIMKVTGFAERRGDARCGARCSIEDLTPTPELRAPRSRPRPNAMPAAGGRPSRSAARSIGCSGANSAARALRGLGHCASKRVIFGRSSE